MKILAVRTTLFAFLIWGIISIPILNLLPEHQALAADEASAAASSTASPADTAPPQNPADDALTAANNDVPVQTQASDTNASADADDEDSDDLSPSGLQSNTGSGLQIADPIEPFNRAMYQFNDKLYFWVLKPVATGYGMVVPEMVRVSVKNFFTNLAFPIRFVSSVLQADVPGAAQETGRFFINSIWGLAGLFDPASMEGANLPKQDPDLGQSLGLWGIGQGFYIVWPVFGPSSPRDTLGTVGEYFLYPVSYLKPWYASTGTKSYELINDTSLRIGDYEALKGAALDPYIAIRDAYVQYRSKKIENKRAKLQGPPPLKLPPGRVFWPSEQEQKNADK